MSTATRITLAEYDRMIAEGKFEGGLTRPHIELIDGELREMSPVGPLHEEVVDTLTEWSITNLPRQTIRVRTQNSVGIPELGSAPQPDVAWVARKSYRTGRPVSNEILLIIEVADSSLEYDRGEKANVYAAAGTEDYWVVNVRDRCVEVFRKPESGRFTLREIVRAPAAVQPLALPQVALRVEYLFPAGRTAE
jgi:Uma2 family endonuclease